MPWDEVPLGTVRGRRANRRSGSEWLRLSRVVPVAVALNIPVWGTGRAQEARHSTTAVAIREIYVDSLLLSFGVDSARIRFAIQELLRNANRLSVARGSAVPALDVSLTVPRSLTGGKLDVRALLRVEVGRNRIEEGHATVLVWQLTSTLSSYQNWQALSDAVLREVRIAVEGFLASSD